MNMEKIKLLENLIRRIVESEDEEYYKISPGELIKFLDFSNNNLTAVTNLPMFGGKKLWVTGDLDLSERENIKDLGNIGYIDGKLDISGTNIGNTDGVKIKGYLRYWNSKKYRLEQAAIKRQKLADADSRRENREWDPDNTDEVGLKANALFDWLVDQNELTVISDEEKEKLKNLQNELERLTELYDSEDLEPDEISDLYDKITEIEEEIEELTSEKVDVYDLVESGEHYGITKFESLTLGDREYCVGTVDEMDDALESYWERYIEDVGMDGFNRRFIENYIDEDKVREVVEEHFDYDVRENPDVYFDEDDFELTDEQEQRKEQLENYISELEDMKSELEDKQREIEDSDSDEYSEIEEKLEEIDENIDTAQEELDSIEPDTEPTEEMITNKIEELVDDRMSNPLGFLREMGLNFTEYIDEDELLKSLVRDNDYGSISTYDGSYDVEEFDGESYYIIRVS